MPEMQVWKTTVKNKKNIALPVGSLEDHFYRLLYLSSLLKDLATACVLQSLELWARQLCCKAICALALPMLRMQLPMQLYHESLHESLHVLFISIHWFILIPCFYASDHSMLRSHGSNDSILIYIYIYIPCFISSYLSAKRSNRTSLWPIWRGNLWPRNCKNQNRKASNNHHCPEVAEARANKHWERLIACIAWEAFNMFQLFQLIIADHRECCWS